MSESFRTCDKKGFHITFPNGVTLSTQFGPANYGDNYNASLITPEKENQYGYRSYEVETAAWIGEKWITDEYRPDSGGVIGYLDIDEWLKFFDWCRNYKVEENPRAASASVSEAK